MLRARLRLGPQTARFLERHARYVRASEEDLPWHREADRLLNEAGRRIAIVEARRAA